LLDLRHAVENLPLNLRRERFDIIGTAKRIDGVGKAVLVGEDLQGTQRDPR
jgi:hypothetical protein